MTQGFVNPYTYAVSAPTVTTYTSGSGTYTVPSGVQYLVVELVGGGGGGGGGGTTGAGIGVTGGTTTFGSLSATGGGGGAASGNAGGWGASSPGIGSGGDVNAAGGTASPYFPGNASLGTATNGYAPAGGNSIYGGGGRGGANGGDTGKNATGFGGGGGGAGGTNVGGGITGTVGGSGGGYCRKVISNPSATYSYAVGAGGASGTVGTNGAAGGAGSAGIIIIYEYYQTLGIPTTLTLPLPVSNGGTGVSNSNWTAGSLTFSPTTQGIVGTTTNNNAATGYVGEYISNAATGVSLTSNVVANITSISLTAGDWDVYGSAFYYTSGAVGVQFLSWFSSTSATLPANNYTYSCLSFTSGQSTNTGENAPPPTLRFSLSGTTTIYLSGRAQFGSGTCSVDGSMFARRIR
jgi:hypothetical protein